LENTSIEIAKVLKIAVKYLG